MKRAQKPLNTWMRTLYLGTIIGRLLLALGFSLALTSCSSSTGLKEAVVRDPATFAEPPAKTELLGIGQIADLQRVMNVLMKLGPKDQYWKPV